MREAAVMKLSSSTATDTCRGGRMSLTIGMGKQGRAAADEFERARS